MTKFQVITLSVFAIFIVIGVAAFATYKGSSSSQQLPAITVWGTFPQSVFTQYVSYINNTYPQAVSIAYTQKTDAQFTRDLVTALARGNGPDAILIPMDLLLPDEDKLALIPYSALSASAFRDTYIRESDAYISANGIMALPFSLDPLVMFWNRDMYDAAGVAVYPHYWDEFSALNQKLTVSDQNGNIRKSAVAMGDFGNVVNAREILGTLLLQGGNPVTAVASDGTVASTLKISYPQSPIPAVQFFGKSVNPSDPDYSWNKSMPDSLTAFLSGTLATYFGFASELKSIREKNPNLNFDVALLPQARTGGVKAVYGRMYGLSIIRTAANANATYQILSILTSAQYLPWISANMYLPSVRRDIIAAGSSDPYISLFNQTALVSSGWLDVDPDQSGNLMGNMISWVTSGQKSISQAVQDTGALYDQALKMALQ